MDTLIDVATLAALPGRPDVLVFDCRFSLADTAAGRRAFAAGHVPGARHADLERDLSAPHVPGRTGRHPLPAREDWLRRVREWGIAPDVQVVAYDDAGGAYAARLWWMLRWAGHRKVAVLDGGWQSWIAAGLPVSAEAPAAATPGSVDYATLAPLATVVEAAAIDPASQCLLDARDGARFRGDVEPIDPVAGHIPGARSAPFTANLGPAGTFRPPAELRAGFAPALESGKPIVCYCGSGVTACHNVLALTHAGAPMPALYAGSWSEWITDPARPVATGE